MGSIRSFLWEGMTGSAEGREGSKEGKSTSSRRSWSGKGEGTPGASDCSLSCAMWDSEAGASGDGNGLEAQCVKAVLGDDVCPASGSGAGSGAGWGGG
jgi:hypothetical protein